ncbi:MAG: hypothetical protein JO247_11650 [Chloroflexi bacterium]|nr:hypothetical protein [Chloroflexota bacterium]
MKTSPLRAMLLGLVALSLAGCSPAGATQVAQSAQARVEQAATRGLQTVRAHLPGGTAATSADQSAIQLLIQRGDLEQEQAIARKDSSVMKDTSTDTYFQDVAQQNQDMLDSGITAIKLVSVEWGSISVNGSTATADNYETWDTSYSDGSHDQERDHNVYTLTKRSGGWLIQADDQPDNPSPVSASPAPSAAPSGQGGRGSGSPAPSGRGRPAPAAPAASSSSTAPLSVAAQPGSPEAAVEQVILKGNQEQEQAISSKDTSVMKDTSTDSYYQDLADNNQGMLDDGVTSIKLLQIEWGQVTINGNSATASTFETWSSDYSDGTTEQSRDQNVYTLVQQNGQWKIESDDHPGDNLIPGSGSGGSQPSASGSPGASPAQRVPRGRGTSSNWSGYAATGGKFTSVSGTWTVPQPSNDGNLGADAAWVGIGGANSRDLLQAGTEETVLGSGRAHYDAWIEMLPQTSHPVPLPVHPGDSVSVSIAQQSNGDWLVSFKNNTSGATYQRTVQYQSSTSSAEWIEEAPSGGRGGIMPIDSFGSITFSDAATVKDGNQDNLQQAGAQPITMINRNNEPLVQPSAVTSDGGGFTVTRTGSQPSAGRPGSGTPRSRTSG